MSNIEFKDACIISRWDNETYDENGLPVYEQIYNGKCLYQEKDNASLRNGMIQTSPNLYLPKNNILFVINDKVEVTTVKSRIIHFAVDNVRDIDGRLFQCTKLMLKEGESSE